MSGTIDLEDTLKKAESIYNQVLGCKTLPESIREIMHLQNSKEGDTAVPSSAASMNNIIEAAASTASSPDRQPQPLRIPGRAVQKTETLTSPTSDTGNAVTTPDDSSIEILPEDHVL